MNIDNLICISIYWDRDIVICFKKVLKDPNAILIMEQIKLQCLCSVELKDVRKLMELVK